MKRNPLEPDPETYKVDEPKASNYLFEGISKIYDKVRNSKTYGSVVNAYNYARQMRYAVTDRSSETFYEPPRV